MVREFDHGGRRSAGTAGLQSCGSVWSCPVCARKISARRGQDVGGVLSAVQDANGSAAMVTLTMRHRKGMRLSVLWAALSAAWAAATSGGAWQREKEQFGVLGWLRTVEATHGENGWHIHVHAVMAFDSPMSAEMMEQLGIRMFNRWARALARKKLSAVAESGGLDVRPVAMTADSVERIGEYMSKIAYEVTSPSTKDGRYGNRSPFAILRDALATSLADDAELWLEWEKASHGKRQLTWSQGLRDWARLGREQTDEEIVAEDHGGRDLFVICPEDWPRIAHVQYELLDAVEVGGMLGGIRWLQAHGIRWWCPPPHRRRDGLVNK